MDTLSKERRSWNMSRIRGQDTGPERLVRSLLHRMGFRFRLHRADLPGKPDLVLPKWRVVVLVHGCFWHRHRGCRLAYTPKSRNEFWSRKFTRNIERDLEVQRQLRKLKWRVIVIWECELEDQSTLCRRLRTLICWNQAKTSPVASRGRS